MLALVLPLLWLLVVVFLLGYALVGERNLRALLYGLAALALLATGISTIGAPLHWALFLGIAGIPAGARYYFVDMKNAKAAGKEVEKPRGAKEHGGAKKENAFDVMAIVKSPDFLAAMAIIFTFVLLYQGSTSYPWLEDDDPWRHALGVNQVAQTLSAQRPVISDPTQFERWYLEPYPPAFDIIMGMLRQLNDSTSMTLKFFNALLCAGAVLAFYLWMRDAFPDNPWIGAVGAVFIAATPGFMSHFIWSQTLAIVLIFTAMMALARLEKEPKFLPQAGICVAAVLIAQPTIAILFGPITGILLVSHLAMRKFEFSKTLFIALALGLAVSLAIFWLPMYFKFGQAQFISDVGIESSFLTGGTASDTSGGVVYTLEEFIFPSSSSKIDQAVGIGLALVLLSLVASFMVAKEALAGKGSPILIFLVLFMIFGYLGTEGNALPIKLFPHRFWVFLAIPIAALSAYALLKVPKKSLLLLFTSNQPIGTITGGGNIRDEEGKEKLSGIGDIKVASAPHELQSSCGPASCPHYADISFSALASETGFRDEYSAKASTNKTEIYARSGTVYYAVIVAIALILFFTSINPRIAVQTAEWPPGTGFSSMEEVQGYVYLLNLTPNTKVFPLCSPLRGDEKVAGMDKMSEPWDEDYHAFKKTAFNRTPEEAAAFLKPRNYSYLIIDSSCILDSSEDATQKKLGDYSVSSAFALEKSSPGFILFKLK